MNRSPQAAQTRSVSWSFQSLWRLGYRKGRLYVHVRRTEPDKELNEPPRAAI